MSATQTVLAEQKGPVVVQVSAQVQGTIAAQTLTVMALVTVTNHTRQPIYLAGACDVQAPLELILIRQGAAGLHIPIPPIATCMVGDGLFDLLPAIAPDSPHTWTGTIALCGIGRCWQAGTYVLMAVAADWHQGTIQQVNAGVPVLSGGAQGQTVIALA